MESGGFIKIHRIMTKWQWYQNSKMVHILIHFILSANHAERKWQGITLLPGQFISGRKAISKVTGLSEKSIRTCIKKLEKCGEVATKTANRFTVFTLLKWEEYQMLDYKGANKGANKGPTKGQQRATNNNDNNEKNEKNKDTPSREEVFVWWNQLASKTGIPAVKIMVNDRWDKFKLRVPEGLWDARGEIETQINASDFLKSWVGFDWIVSNSKNWLKIIEGNYKGGKDNGSFKRGKKTGKYAGMG